NSAFAQLWLLEDQYLNAAPKLGDLMEKLRENRRLPEQADFRKFKQSWLNMFTALINPHEDMLYLPNGRALRMLTVPHPMGGLMMTFEDVTSRLELESSYNTLIAVQKETLDNLTEGVAVYGGDGRLKLWNPAFARLWGLHPEDLADQPHINRIVEKMKGKFPAEVWEHRRAELIAHSIDRRTRDGRIEYLGDRLIAYSTVPLPDGGVLVTHVDVTDTARVENALREKNAALQAAERLKLDFIANVSYQLRTPLNAIMGFTEILGNEYFGPLNARQKEYTVGMSDASDRLLTLINNILDLSSIEAGYMELETADVDVCAMLNGLTDLTCEWARKEKIEVKLDCPADIGTINADEPRLKQVMLNLIRNAMAFTPAGGTITVTANRSPEKLQLIVSDTGSGIAAHDQERIFEPFERAQAGGSRGAGLGLTLVKNIIEMHKGTVALQSAAGLGTTVTITLPA
ncbi:MAG: PAS domain-containing sensor histidine kinase, partial [Alphaproteobacteria bacterium]|nr:PAS domain-containing sensor histidine kinase [Alphaproteobacteria bacterium]